VFSYLSEACDLLSEEGRKELQAIRDWFNERLDAPDLLTIERFWFCAEAQEYVVRARRLAEVLCSIGIPIVERRTRRVPGKVKWQDKHQVAVLTYRDTVEWHWR
jgi:hypothetical protein